MVQNERNEKGCYVVKYLLSGLHMNRRQPVAAPILFSFAPVVWLHVTEIGIDIYIAIYIMLMF